MSRNTLSGVDVVTVVSVDLLPCIIYIQSDYKC